MNYIADQGSGSFFLITGFIEWPFSQKGLNTKPATTEPNCIQHFTPSKKKSMHLSALHSVANIWYHPVTWWWFKMSILSLVGENGWFVLINWLCWKSSKLKIKWQEMCKHACRICDSLTFSNWLWVSTFMCVINMVALNVNSWKGYSLSKIFTTDLAASLRSLLRVLSNSHNSYCHSFFLLVPVFSLNTQSQLTRKACF